jgi:AcrR family transcriptional regulator
MAAIAKTARRAEANTKPVPRVVKRDNGRRRLLDAAAGQFRRLGFSGASMRDIAGAAGMLAGSAYYHFPSKEMLFVAVHEEGIRRITAAVVSALAGVDDPWARIEAAARAHLSALLDGGDYAQVVIRDVPGDAHETHARLIALRDAYEQIFRDLVAALPLPPGVDKGRLRLMLLGALNWATRWYRPGGASPEEIARDFVALLRQSLDPAPRNAP